MNRGIVLLSLAVVPLLLQAESATPSIGFAGAPADHNGQNCSACHNSFPVNSTALTVNVTDYKPGVQQLISIIVQDPQANTWGFQITIREVSDETQSAGTFSTESSNVQVVCDDGSQFGSAPPCMTARQFAEHKGAQHTAVGAGFQFDVPWMPPEQEVGRLHVYVSAVAANGDGTPSGDRVYTFVGTLNNAGACGLTGVPNIRSVVNGASFLQSFSSAAFVSIYGVGFQVSGHTRTARLGDFVNGGFPAALACVAVQVAGPGLAQPVLIPVVYVQSDQINAQMPEFSGTGTVTVRVLLNPGAFNEVTGGVATFDTELQPFSPAFFMFNSTSVAAQFGGTAQVVADPSVVAGGRPARPGDIVTLYGTGFGDTNPLVPAGQLAATISRLTNPITVTVGGVTLSPSDVLYAGLSPGSISGLYQFNIRIPESTPSGAIPIGISIGNGLHTQAGATIPIQ